MKPTMALLLLVVAHTSAHAQRESQHPGTTQHEAVMTARGPFDVKVIPQPPDDSAGGPFSRLFLDKVFHGDLEGTGKGQMMAARTAVEGSAAYVALELVTGTLNGHRGSFVLQHVGRMRNGTSPTLTVVVVPDSGTDQLVGLHGTMIIINDGGKHSYEFEYGGVGV